MCSGVESRVEWVATPRHLKWNRSASVVYCFHHEVQVVGRSPVSRIPGIQRRERISEPLCARIQNCKILGYSPRSKSKVATATLGGYILHNSPEPIGHKGDKEPCGRNGMSVGQAWLRMSRGMSVGAATSYWCRRVRKWQDLGYSEDGRHVRCA